MGFSTKRSLTALREAITIIRALLRGEEVNFAGAAFNVQRLKLDYRARADIAIFMPPIGLLTWAASPASSTRPPRNCFATRWCTV